jgi:hypothetical protein
VEAARLLGAADAMSTAGQTFLELSERIVHDRALDTLRVTLGGAELRRHWQAGTELTSDEAVAEGAAIVEALALEATRS